MKNIGIIGLGLIGGSLARTTQNKTSYAVFGTDENDAIIKLGLNEEVLSAELSKNNAKYMDFLMVALYPLDVARVIREYVPYLKKGCIVVDCTGVKQIINNELSKELNEQGIYFIGGHPMAGKEVSGYSNSDDVLFSKASMLLCRDEYTNEEAFATATDFFKEIGFLKVVDTTPSEHDRIIAYTSQMAHVVSSSYIKSPTLEKRLGFSAGSFKDLTRVAKLNEYVWADLFLANKDDLLAEIDLFMGFMKEYRDALEKEDKQMLIQLLAEGRELKEADEEREINARYSDG